VPACDVADQHVSTLESEDKKANVLSSDDGVSFNVMNEPCVVCCLPGNEDECLLCDTCHIAMHNNCVGLSCIPVGDRSCPWCDKTASPTSKEVLFRASDLQLKQQINSLTML
jgi:hypothetical protein